MTTSQYGVPNKFERVSEVVNESTESRRGVPSLKKVFEDV